VTKIEKDLVRAIEEKMQKKNVKEGNPAEMFTVTKRSNRDYFAIAKVGQQLFSAQGVDTKSVIKNLIAEMD
jgi:hypothetical protein